MIGVVASVGWTTERWPRFLSQDVHRNLSLLCLAFVGVHVVTTVADGYVPIGLLDAVIPFRSPYRPLYVGLGALTLDLLLAVLVTSALRRRIGYASWRFVHWLAYLCWPIAVLHGLGSGSDTSLPLTLAIDALSAAAVLGSVAWRLVAGRTFPAATRAAVAVGTSVAALAILVFAVVGPLRPGWSRRSGTSAALLAQLARRNAPTAGTASAPTPTTPATPAVQGGVPAAPFSVGISGSQTASSPDTQGNVQVTLSMHLQDAAATPLTVVLVGTAVQGGGVAMSSGSVTFGPYHGTVTALDGGTVQADVSTPRPEVLTLSLQVDQGTGALTGTVSGQAGTSGGGSR